jgi:hypothetical protein
VLASNESFHRFRSNRSRSSRIKYPTEQNIYNKCLDLL